MLAKILPTRQVISQPITLDYLRCSPKISEFFPAHFRTKNFRDIRVDRPQIAKNLTEYNQTLNAPAKVMENIKLLRSDNNFAVITGQQPGLFTGPLFTIYKAFSAIIISKRLSNSRYQFVPIFWNASEDHDLREMNHIYVMKDNKPLRIDCPLRGKGSASEVELDQEKIGQAISRISQALPDTEFKDSILEKFQSLSSESKNLGDFFSRIMLYLLGEYGLILIEPKYLRKPMIPLFKRMIDNPAKCSKILNETGARLKELGYSPPIHKSPNLCNFFVERKKVIYDGDFQVGDHTYSRKELLHLLEKDPFSFSANAVTRPITQDYILPTYAYVAGPSEITYFAQLSQIYREFGMEMPVIYPRFGATVIENKVLMVLRKYDLKIFDLESPQALVKRLVAREIKPVFNSGRKRLQEIFRDIEETALKINGSLGDSCQVSLGRVLKEMGALEDKLTRSLKRQNIIVERQVYKAANNVFPENELQERKINLLEYLIKFGPNFLSDVYREFLKSDYGEHRVIKLPS
ncbi:MAG: bacillithiol biosynthesis cysteine-adding enzyme BshC, partial [bacterium]